MGKNPTLTWCDCLHPTRDDLQGTINKTRLIANKIKNKIKKKWSSSNLSVAVLQRRLIEIGQPLSWTPPGALPPLPTGFACALGRCVGVTSRNNVSNTSTCDAKCPSLGPNEWLALVDEWVVNGSTIEARSPCQLTKSTAQALVLPPQEKLSVSGGSQCTLISGEVLEQHYLCSRLSSI